MIRPETLRPFAEDWQAPTADEIKEVLELIRQRKGLSKPLSGVDVADLVGLLVREAAEREPEPSGVG